MEHRRPTRRRPNAPDAAYINNSAPKDFKETRVAAFMRPIRIFLALSVAFVALSGCLDDEDTQTDSADAPMADAIETVEPRSETYACATTMGAAVISFNGIGGCYMGAAAFTGMAANLTLPGGCNIAYDANGDQQSDGEVTAGTMVESGWELFVFCGPGASGESSFDVVEVLEDAEEATDEEPMA